MRINDRNVNNILFKAFPVELTPANAIYTHFIALKEHMPNRADTVNRLRDTKHLFSYYMAKSVFAMWLINLRSVTCYTDQNIKSKCSFRSSKSLCLEKMFEEGYKISVNVEDLNVDFVLQHSNLCLFVNEADEETESQYYRRREFQCVTCQWKFYRSTQ